SDLSRSGGRGVAAGAGGGPTAPPRRRVRRGSALASRESRSAPRRRPDDLAPGDSGPRGGASRRRARGRSAPARGRCAGSTSPRALGGSPGGLRGGSDGRGGHGGENRGRGSGAGGGGRARGRMGLIRVIGGDLRGRRTRVPDQGVRPTSERAREAVFDILGPSFLNGARVLDLYAGSGALGIEALSRGADFADFAERSRTVARTLEENLATLGLSARGR